MRETAPGGTRPKIWQYAIPAYTREPKTSLARHE
jgi:hypothetical protein